MTMQDAHDARGFVFLRHELMDYDGKGKFWMVSAYRDGEGRVVLSGAPPRGSSHAGYVWTAATVV